MTTEQLTKAYQILQHAKHIAYVVDRVEADPDVKEAIGAAIYGYRLRLSTKAVTAMLEAQILEKLKLVRDLGIEVTRESLLKVPGEPPIVGGRDERAFQTSSGS